MKRNWHEIGVIMLIMPLFTILVLFMLLSPVWAWIAVIFCHMPWYVALIATWFSLAMTFITKGTIKDQYCEWLDTLCGHDP